MVHSCRCNGSVTLELVAVDDHRQTRSFKSYGNRRQQSVSMLKLCGMEGAAMDYAIHGHAIAHIQMGQSEIDCVVSHRDPNNHGLLLHLPKKEIPPLPKESVYVHFEINHNYFDGLHKAVDYLSPIAVSKLFPEKKHLKRAVAVKSALSASEESVIKEFTLDSEYQMRALKQMISSDPKVPFLVIGAFGTGKTHILAAAASALLCDPTTVVSPLALLLNTRRTLSLVPPSKPFAPLIKSPFISRTSIVWVGRCLNKDSKQLTLADATLHGSEQRIASDLHIDKWSRVTRTH